MKTKTIAIVANMLLLIVIVPSYASDFFPLDVWKEMANWQPNNAAFNENDIGAYSQPRSMDADKSEMIHTSFPFDVMDALNDLDSKDGDYNTGRLASIGNSHGHQTNPYWLPAGYSTD